VANNREKFMRTSQSKHILYAWTGFFLFVTLMVYVAGIKSDEFSTENDYTGIHKDQEEVIDHFIKHANDGVIYAFSDPASAATSQLRMDFFLAEPSKLPLDMTFYSLADTRQDYYIMCLVDYDPVPCNVDNGSELLIKASFTPGIKNQEKFILPVLHSGRHDITIVGLNITKHSGNSIPYDNILYRASVVVSEDTSPSLTYENRSDFDVNSRGSKLLNYKNSSGLCISPKQLDMENYHYARIVNPLEFPMRYAVVMVTVGKTSREKSVVETRKAFVRAKEMSEARLIVSSEFSLKESITFFIAVENPYIKLEYPPGKVNQEEASILTSNIVTNSN
jgi:hypothetical protein